MKENCIITIGRQLGSGGRVIGEKLAQELGFGFYDKELIGLAAQESGLNPEFFEQADEKTSGSLFGGLLDLYFPIPGDSGLSYGSYLSSDVLFKVQSDVIRKLSETQSCIFVGRCADYILRDHPRRTDIFVSADLDDRIARISELHGISEKQAREMIEKGDKKRAAYYNYYSSKTWGRVESYHLCINSSALGINETAEFIKEFARRKLAL